MTYKTQMLDNWHTKGHPRGKNTWCWIITLENKATKNFFPAYWDGRTWTNGDTWEDFDKEVFAWVTIPVPSKLKL